MKKQGSVVIVIIFAALLILLLGFAYWYWSHRVNNSSFMQNSNASSTMLASDIQAVGIHGQMRPDVASYIATHYPNSAKLRSALTQLAQAELNMIADVSNAKLVQQDALDQGYALECLSASTSSSVDMFLTSIDNQVQNTPFLFKTYLQAEAEAEQNFTYTLSNDPASRCLVPPSQFSN